MLRQSAVPQSQRNFRRGLAFASLWSAVAVPALLLVAVLSAQNQKAQPRSKNPASGDVARGKYIVENVARCAQCHTPHDSNGSPDRAHWLQGGPVPFNPPKPDPNWPLSVPRIGGTPLPASDEDMVKLLTTGIWTTGTYLRAPMPQFRLDRSDAEAVVAYLKSVTAQPQ
jgi:mono/diheme cytochrome c family protein